MLVPRSADLSRIPSWTEAAASLTSRSPSIAIIGNSAGEAAIDTSVVAQAFRASGSVEPALAIFAPDGSGATTWAAVAWSEFWSRGRTPTALVLAAPAYSLNDDENLDVGRLARFFPQVAQWHAIFDSTFLPDQRLDFRFSSWFAAWAFRQRLARRIAPAKPSAPGGAAAGLPFAERPQRLVAGTHHAFGAILEEAGATGTRVVVALMPLRDEIITLSPEVVAMLASHEVTLIDLQRTPGLAAASFVDNIHVGPSGRAIVSGALAAAVSRSLSFPSSP